MPVKFRLGQVLLTSNLSVEVDGNHDVIYPYITRHQNGDWGDLDKEDKERNEEALRTGGRIFSMYHMPTGLKFYVITEADRSATTALLPEDY